MRLQAAIGQQLVMVQNDPASAEFAEKTVAYAGAKTVYLTALRKESIRLTNYTADHGAGLLGLLSVRPCGGREFSDLVNWKVAQSWQD